MTEDEQTVIVEQLKGYTNLELGEALDAARQEHDKYESQVAARTGVFKQRAETRRREVLEEVRVIEAEIERRRTGTSGS